MAASGLAKDSVSFYPLLAQSVATVAPMGAALGTLLGTASYAGAAFPLSVLFAMVVTVLWINTPYQFSKKISGAGGFYHFATEGVSPTFGAFNGWFYIFNYFFFVAPGGILIFGAILPGVLQVAGVSGYPSNLWIPLNIIFILGAFALAYYGIRPSLKFSLVASILEIGFLVLLSFIIIGASGSSNTAEVYSPSLSPTGLSGIFLGAVFGFTAISGVSGAVYLGEEAKAPIKNIKKAVLLSYVLTALTFILFSYAMTIGWGVSNMSSFAGSGVPGIILADQFLGTPGLVIITLLVINSIFAATLAPLNSSGRLVFSMGRDGILPTSFARVSEKRRTPGLALLLITVVAITVSTIAGLVFGPLNGFVFLILLAGVASLAGHFMGSVALPMYFRKIKLNPILHLVAPVLYIASAIAIGYSLFVPFAYPVYYAPILVAIWAVLGAFIFLSAKRRLREWSKVGRPPAEGP